jgi:hypothetical protein
MKPNAAVRLSITCLAVALAGVLASPTRAAAQTLTGQARAVQSATLLGTTTLADSGTLAGAGDTRDASVAVGGVPSMLSGEALRAVTVGWSDQVASEASLSNLAMTVGGTGITAGVVLARVLAAAGQPAAANSNVGDLAINGIPVQVTGSPNQTISIPGGRLVVNEQIVSMTGTTVNALHATVFGVADVVVASAIAGIQ